MTPESLSIGMGVIVRHDPGNKPPRPAKVTRIHESHATVRIKVGLNRYAGKDTNVPFDRVVREATKREMATGMTIGALAP